MAFENNQGDENHPAFQADKNLRRQAEDLARTKPMLSVNLEAMSMETMRQTLHELQVYQIELEMQNEELRRTQLQLDAARARYFNLYDLAPVGYCTVDGQGQVQEANLAAAALLGLPRSKLLGQAINRFIVPSHQDSYYLCSKQLRESGAPQRCELQIAHSDGTQCWVQLMASTTQDADGATLQHLVLNDVSESKIMAAAMRESEARYRGMVEWSPEPICVHRARTIIYVNTAANNMFGAHSQHDLVGQPLLDRIHPDFRTIELDRIQSMTRLNVATPMLEEVMLRLDGSAIFVELQSISTVYDGAPAIQVSMRDVTEHKRLAALLQEKNAELQRVLSLANGAPQAAPGIPAASPD